MKGDSCPLTSSFTDECKDPERTAWTCPVPLFPTPNLWGFDHTQHGLWMTKTQLQANYRLRPTQRAVAGFISMPSIFTGKKPPAPTPPERRSCFLCPFSWNGGFKETPTQTPPISALPSHCSHPHPYLHSFADLLGAYASLCCESALGFLLSRSSVFLGDCRGSAQAHHPVPPALTRTPLLSALACSPSHAQPGPHTPRTVWGWRKFGPERGGLRGPRGRLQPRTGWRQRGRSGPGRPHSMVRPSARPSPPRFGGTRREGTG